MFKIFDRRERTGMPEQDGASYEWRDGVYLCTVSTSIDAEIIMSKLRSEGIPSEKKFIGSASYLEVVFGANRVGAIEIYVPEETLEDAKNIIVAVDLDDCEEVDFDDEDFEDDQEFDEEDFDDEEWAPEEEYDEEEFAEEE